MSSRRPPDALRALGRVSPPVRLQLPDGIYRLVRVFKHDFFAATCLYESGGDRIVVKFGRQADFAGLPLAWLGRWLVAHECYLYQWLASVPGVPAFRGRIGPNAFAHTYVEGHALERGEHTADAFFDQLTVLIEELHARGVAYVDLEKPENVLVGDDGRPYLIDFQISWPWPAKAENQKPKAESPERTVKRHFSILGFRFSALNWIRRKLQQGDRYHLLKLRRRCRPDQLSSEQLAILERKPFPIRVHARLIAPLQRIRRSLLQRLEAPTRRGKRGERGRV
ncbi:MAG TPA: hypothetical protein VGM03_23775 [Phycisphaerae bacterium]|jgi:hypothetical protein